MIVMLLGLVHTLLHELGHVLAALLVGSKVKRAGISLRGLYVVRTAAPAPWRNALAALGGPAINLLSWAVLSIFHTPYAWVALFIGGFNLMPFPHSDLMKCLSYLRDAQPEISAPAAPHIEPAHPATFANNEALLEAKEAA
jgi:hypothetical protein